MPIDDSDGDNDGTPDSHDTDDDGDGVPDEDDEDRDTDGDGTPDIGKFYKKKLSTQLWTRSYQSSLQSRSSSIFFFCSSSRFFVHVNTKRCSVLFHPTGGNFWDLKYHGIQW